MAKKKATISVKPSEMVSDVNMVKEETPKANKQTSADKALEAKLARGFVQIVGNGKSGLKAGKIYLVSVKGADTLVKRGFAEYKK